MTLKRVLITGAEGFIGKNLTLRLAELGRHDVTTYTRSSNPDQLPSLIADADVVVHLAGENRPDDPSEFQRVNVQLTRKLCDAIEWSGRRITLLLASSTQAALDNPYGRSKREAETIASGLCERSGVPVAICRFPGVFGKWCRPNYNSVVATFCHNIARGEQVHIHDPESSLTLVYIDDVVDMLVDLIDCEKVGISEPVVSPVYELTVGRLAELIQSFRSSRTSTIGRVGHGLERALYSTYVSYLPPSDFSYPLVAHSDERGQFVEMLKTEDAGQLSFFTINPGFTRGSHYHHTKTEKFLVVRGSVRMRFRSLETGEKTSFDLHSSQPTVVDSIPGWVHDITNIGTEDAIVMLWANEVFDRDRPDTIAETV